MATQKWAAPLSLLIIGFMSAIDAGEVCYGNGHGCFNNNPPFTNVGKLPESPEKIKTKFILFQPNDQGSQGTEISHIDMNTVTQSGMKLGLPLKIIVHGFCSTGRDEWILKTKDAFMSKLECNVVAVDWRIGAGVFPSGGCSPFASRIDLPFYSQAVANTRLVGKQIEMLLVGMRGLGLNLGNVHIVGHSLGAHTAGTAGWLLQGQLLRISGLDPAGPNFKDQAIQVRLDATDAKFVDVIHTDAEGWIHFGIGQPSGHVDFYPNGGSYQPGCSSRSGRRPAAGSRGGDFTCSHSRAHEFFLASLQPGSVTCTFPAVPCGSWADYVAGKCKNCGVTGCSEMGYPAITHSGRGKLFLRTTGSWPFCSK